MADHDQVAELRALITERDTHRAAGRDQRAQQVQGEIARVSGALADRAAMYASQADIHSEAGASVLAGQAQEQAAALQAVLAELDPAIDEQGPPGERTTAESRPRRTATTRRSTRESSEGGD